jgi:hypothetical protein
VMTWFSRNRLPLTLTLSSMATLLPTKYA